MRSTREIARYGALWRLHFFAALFVAPLLLLMSATGAAYLFKDEIETALDRPLRTATAGRPQSPGSWLLAAEQATDGAAQRLVVPRAGEAAQVLIRSADGEMVRVYVDPTTSGVNGVSSAEGAMAWVKDLHSLTLLGPQANLLAELAAGWVIVLVVTGVFVWRPWREAAAVSGRRGAWRRVHAWTGATAGVVIVFLALTGMPWSAFWGQQMRSLTNDLGLGRPPVPVAAGAWGPAPGKSTHGDHTTPWALQDSHLHHRAAEAQVDREAGLGRALAATEAAGLPRPFTLSLSDDPTLAWAASHAGARVEETRTLYLRPQDGAVLADVGYADFGPAAQAIEWGVQVHQGRQYGELNRVLMLAGCVATWGLTITGLAMWWIRRPSRRFGAPPPPTNLRDYDLALLIVAPFALLFPLVGASLIVAGAIEIGLHVSRRRSAVIPKGAS